MGEIARVSVIITNFNRISMVGRAIRSCLDQATPHRDLEIIVVDDGSDDGSREYLRMFGDRVVLVLHDRNMGVAQASNSGLARATGRYVMRVDSDDFLNRYAVHTLAGILDENPAIDFAYCDLLKVDVNGFPIARIDRGDPENLFDYGAGILFRREVIEQAGGYDPSLPNSEDYDLLLQVCRDHKGFHLPLAYYRYYMHGDNLSQNGLREKFKQMVNERHGIQNR
ncbi:glycosyltransferase [Pseudodesulfovibrio sp.]|uniref:glycosyltransferase n=1 Tax=Pseudodesulfovibrio sp. TaxID=2035812 RepID=UPI002610C223|nr:glycosyltransferase [Pseudodesulfovibrio sp.]MDD3312394.1 glycosyltransferase [Pseudodesulfovibrio sp.]